MKNIVRLLLCAVMCMMLALAPSAVCAQEQNVFAQMAVTLPDGTQEFIPAYPVVTSMGDTVYWVDYSMLTPEQTAALAGGQLVFTNELGEVLAQIPYALDSAMTPVYDTPNQIADPLDPNVAYTVFFAAASAPMTAPEADAVFAPFGFEMPTPEPTEEPTPEPTEEPTPEPTEEPTPEPTEEPTPEPTEEPTPEPTEEPTPEPTEEPTPEPTEEPTPEPTEEPVVEPIVPDEPQESEPEQPVQVQLPQTPFYTMSDNLYGNYSDLYDAVYGNVIGQLDNGTVLFVYEAIAAQDGSVWYAAVNPLDEEVFGFIRAELTFAVSQEDAQAYVEEMLAAQQATPVPTEEPVIEEITPEPTEEPVIEEITPEPTQEPVIEEITPEPTQEPVIEEITPEPTQEAQSETFYAVTNNQNSNVNNLRDGMGGSVVAEISNGELAYVSEVAIDGEGKVWYAVTFIKNGETGYMRDYLLTRISDEDAQMLIAAMQPTQAPTMEPTQEPVIEEITPEPTQEPVIEEITPEPTQEPVIEEITPEPTQEPVIEEITPEPTQEAQSETFYAVTNNQNSNVNNLRNGMGGSVVAEISNGELAHVSEVAIDGEGKVWYAVTFIKNGETGYMRDYLLTRISDADAQMILAAMQPQEPEQNEPEQTTEPETEATATPAPTMEFPAYGMTIAQQATIVLRTAPAADLPTSGAIPTINEPTPLELLAGEYDANGELWYLVASLNDGISGYVEAYKVEIVSREQAMGSIKQDEATPLPPPATEEPVITPTPEPTATPEPTPTPTAEPTPTPIPEEPQELNQGDVYHYGYTNKAQVNLREKAKQSSDSLGKLSSGTILWVMTLDGEWCHVRADLGNGTVKTGYMKSEFVTLMGENEEIAYRATLADPEVAPETPTPVPTEPLIEEITPEPTEEPTPTPEVTATPEPTPEATATPEPTPTAEPTATPAPIRLDLYARVINDATPLRGNPDANAYLQTILDAETVVYIFQSQVAADGMTWYLVQYSGQWGFIRADLVRVMGEQETAEYLAALEAALATPTPMPQVTPEPIGPESTSAYAKLIKDSVNLRRTPSSSGTSLGRIPVNTLLLVTGEEYDGTYTWYQVNYNGQDGFVRSDMAQMLTIAELQEYLAQQAQTTPKPGTNSNANSSNNVDYVINGSPLQDLIPVPDSWTNNVIQGMPGYATATPDPNATATPAPVKNPAALIKGEGTMAVYNVPATTENGAFSIYGKTKPYANVKATVDMSAFDVQNPVSGMLRIELVATAIAESSNIRLVGQTIADKDGNFTMDVRLPQPGEYIVEFAADGENFARYGVTYDAGETPAPVVTAAPLPTAEPIEEEGGFGVLPFAIGGLLIVVIAVIYGIHVYNRRAEEEDEDEEDEDEEDELREQQRTLVRERRERAQNAAAAPRKPMNTGTQVPSYMKNPGAQDTKTRVNPYARPAAPAAPTAPEMPVKPAAPKTPEVPAAPVAPVAPKAPEKPVVPVMPEAPEKPAEMKAPADVSAPQEGQVRRRRRPPVDPNA